MASLDVEGTSTGAEFDLAADASGLNGRDIKNMVRNPIFIVCGIVGGMVVAFSAFILFMVIVVAIVNSGSSSAGQRAYYDNSNPPSFHGGEIVIPDYDGRVLSPPN